jgi:uncharacterized membrane protein YgcG
MAGINEAEVNVLIEAALAVQAAAWQAAAAHQANNMPAVPAIPAVFSLTPGTHNMNLPLNFANPADCKIHNHAVTGLVPQCDGTESSLRVCVRGIDLRAGTNAWNPTLLVPDSDGVIRKLTVTYGLLTIDDVRAHALTYLGTATRNAQASAQMATCICNSLGAEIYMKLLLRSSEYTINGVEDGPCMLKTLISIITIATRATIAMIRLDLVDLPTLMVEVDSDITKFNTTVHDYMFKLAGFDETCADLLIYLFKAYKGSTDPAIVTYVVDKENRWEENELNITSNELMVLVGNKFKTITKKKNAESTRAEIIALNAEREGEGAGRGGGRDGGRGGRGGGRGGRGGRGRDTGEWAWKNVAPTGEESKEKLFRGIPYVYCPNHGATKWVLQKKHSSGCKNAPNRSNDVPTTPAAPTNPAAPSAPNRRQLRYAQALMHAMGDPDLDDDAPHDENI